MSTETLRLIRDRERGGKGGMFPVPLVSHLNTPKQTDKFLGSPKQISLKTLGQKNNF